MVRVHFEGREPVVYPTATETKLDPSGALILNETEVGQGRNPNPPFEQISMVVARTWLATWSRDSGWRLAEPIPDDEAALERPALEVAR